MPSKLIKFFDKEEHATDFQERGRIKLSTLTYFSELEDATRADASEGTGKSLVPGRLPQVSIATGEVVSYKDGHFNFSTTIVSPVFIFCTALPSFDLSKRPETWKYAVEITAPELFLADFKKSIGQAPHPVLGPADIEQWQVRYDKELVTPVQPATLESSQLAYMQKDAIHSFQQEFRFVALYSYMPGAEYDNSYFIQLNNHAKYTRRLAL